MIKNRLQKNLKKLAPWAQRSQIEAFRLYDRDIPEFPFMIDLYGVWILVHDRTEEFLDKEKNQWPQVLKALEELFPQSKEKIVVKKRERQAGLQQYEKLDQKNESFTIKESQAVLKVNLKDYLDTGLFLDHRPLRQTIYKNAAGKKFLNLFCYTGSVSVFAALGGAQCTNVDMSSTYLDWAKDNFKLNQLNPQDHVFLQEDVLQFLASSSTQKYDLIFLDPPTFSNSKRMESDFEVEKDQVFLVENCMRRLQPEGVLYFSNNKRKFKLDPSIESRFFVKDITEPSIPMDFHDKKIHHCFEIRHPRQK